MTRHLIADLEDGRGVSFWLKKRKRDPFYHVCWHAEDGGEKEKTTKETSIVRARDVGLSIIRHFFTSQINQHALRAPPAACSPDITWEEAKDLLRKLGRANNLSPRSFEHYADEINVLARFFPSIKGPSEITAGMVADFKEKRMAEGLSAETVASNINVFRTVWRKWFIREGKVLTENPWTSVEKPKCEKKEPRVIREDEHLAFLRWFVNKYPDWRLPTLFLEVKALIGCRIGELAALPTINLQEGRIVFTSDIAKGRKTRLNKLPPELYAELQAIGQGKSYVFESFKDGLRERLGGHRNQVKDYRPEDLVLWLQIRLCKYFEENPQAKRFKLHNFRGTAMSKAIEAGVPYEKACVAFGCRPETMRKHYVSLDELKVADEVMDRIQNRKGNGG
jgi:integrase